MSDRVVGILGGMGPEATAEFYRYIVSLTPAGRDQDHIKVLMYSNPKIPDRSRAITEGGESPLPYLVESAHVLERAGAGILAIPCNTAHYYLPELQARVDVPVLNMITETLSAFKGLMPAASTVGLRHR